MRRQVGAELWSRSVHGVELTAAGRAFLDHARLALAQVDAAVAAARKAGQPPWPYRWWPPPAALPWDHALRGLIAGPPTRISSGTHEPETSVASQRTNAPRSATVERSCASSSQ